MVRTRTDMTEKLAELSHNDVARLWYKIDTDRRKRAQSEAWATAGSVGDETSVLDQLAVSGDWLDQQEFAPLAYAVDGIIPEGCGLLVGPPKKGKSCLVADIGLAVASGGRALGAIPVKQRPVMYLALEDGHRRLQDRFRRILSGGAIPADISLITVATPSQALCAIAEFIARHAADQPLIILDTLGKIRSAKRPGEDAYQADYAVGAKLKSLVAAAPGSTLLIVHHTRKAESVDFVDSVSGTQGIAGSVDFILALNRKRHANDALLNVTGRDVTEAEYALTADEGVLWRLDGADLASASDAAEHRVAQEKMSDRLMDVFRFVDKSNDAVAATDVAKALDGLDGDTAGKYLRRLAENGYIVKVGRGQYLGKSSGVSEPDKDAGQAMP